MNLTGVLGLILVVITTSLMFYFWLSHRARPQRGFRPIPAFARLRRAIALAVEDGSRLHVSLGSANFFTWGSAFVALSVLERVAQLGSLSDRPPVATSGEGSLAILSQGTLRSGFRAANALEQYDPTRGRLAGLTPFSYAAGAIPAIADENVSANIFIGHLGSEVALLTDMADRSDAFTLAASDSLPGQAVLFAAAQEPLIGEELFASGAYLNAGPFHYASLRAQDVLRWLVIVGLVGGAIYQLIGALFQ